MGINKSLLLHSPLLSAQNSGAHGSRSTGAYALREEPDMPIRANTMYSVRIIIRTDTISPWMLKPPGKSQYQCSPTEGGSPANAGFSSKVAPAVKPLVAINCVAGEPCKNQA
eukprot:5960527-Amphidinium_carterae.1